MYFKPFQYSKVNILEIGIGGHGRELSGGASLKVWRKYFPKGLIYGIDFYDKSHLNSSRIKVFTGDQSDVLFLNKVSEEIGGIDIVVDDGSHVNSHVITSFKTLFPLLRKGGCYVVEDIHTSYDQYYDGDCVNLNNTNTSMGFFKQILDAINYEKIEDECEEFKSVMNNVRSIHFYKNLIFILKK